MSDKAIEVIQESLADHMEYGFTERAAMSVLAALKAAGIELVVLPERQDIRLTFFAVESRDPSAGVVVARGGMITNDGVSNPYQSADDARSHAAALLAAADAAEAVTS